jgi:thioredoxin 1
MMDKLVSDFKGRLKVARLNTDQNAAIAAQYEITTIPTLLIFKDGILVEKFVGVVSESELDDLVDKWL